MSSASFKEPSIQSYHGGEFFGSSPSSDGMQSSPFQHADCIERSTGKSSRYYVLTEAVTFKADREVVWCEHDVASSGYLHISQASCFR